MRLAILMSLTSPWARQVATRLAELGHTVHAVDFANREQRRHYLEGAAGFQAASIVDFRQSVHEVHLIPAPDRAGLGHVMGVPRLRRVLSACQAEALLTLYGGGFALMALLSGFRPYAVYVVGSDVLLARGLRRSLGRLALQHAGLVLANGAYLAEQTARMAPGARIVPLLIGVDTQRFAPAPAAHEEPLRIVCTRGFAPIYNNEYLVRGLAGLTGSLPQFGVTFVSSGPLLEETRRLADALLPTPVRRRVEFLGGVTEERLVQELRRAHIYVSLARSDGTSTALLEALACGLYPVLSDIAQNREWVDPARGNGLLVPLDRPEELSKALAGAILDREARQCAAKYNRELAERCADGRRNAAQLAQSLAALMDRRAAGMAGDTPGLGR